jgi:hypothetical protein
VRVPLHLRRLTSFPALALLAAVAVVPTATLLWPHLPPLHEDEVLPLVPLFLLKKHAQAYGNAFLASCPVSFRGVPLPLTSYVIEGPIKAILYALAYPATRWAYVPEHLIGFYRASNLPWTWALFAAVLAACARLGGARAVWLVLGLLVPDVALVYLGVTDLGRPIHLLAGMILALVLATHVERPTWRAIGVIALAVFIGEWDRADFLWFMAAGLGGVVASCVVVPPRQWGRVVGPVVVAYVLGLAGAALVAPEYFRLAANGAGTRIPLTDVARLWAHLRALLYALDPLGSFQRHFDVGEWTGGQPYVLYRWSYVALAALASIGLAAVGFRERRGALLLYAAFPAGLLLLVVVTAESYLVHHVLVVKPFLYVALAVTAARGTTRAPWRAATLAAWIAIVGAAAFVQMRAFADVCRAPTATGIYGVTWNQSDAWTAAARSGAPLVIALDFGSWVPGALASPADQRWESTGAPDEAALDALMAGQDLVGLVVRVTGPNAWVLDQRRYIVVERAVFASHPGDAWAFVALRSPALTSAASRRRRA